MTIAVIIFILIIFIGVSLYEVPDLLKKNYIRELWVFFSLMLMGFALSIFFYLKALI